jgi:hypothetical protein
MEFYARWSNIEDGNMKFLGSGALDTSLKYIWTFHIFLILIYIYNLSRGKKFKCISVIEMMLLCHEIWEHLKIGQMFFLP